MPRVGNFRQKNNSAEDGIDGTKGYFQRNSGCSAEQKISEFRSEPFRGRENNSKFRSVEQKIKAISRNSLPNTPAEEKTTRNSVPGNKYRSKEFRSESFRGKETTQNKTRQPKLSKIVSEKRTFEVWTNKSLLSVFSVEIQDQMVLS
jgi:hypothetical protein